MIVCPYCESADVEYTGPQWHALARCLDCRQLFIQRRRYHWPHSSKLLAGLKSRSEIGFRRQQIRRHSRRPVSIEYPTLAPIKL